MSLKDRIKADINRVFINFDHYASTHLWNGYELDCVCDEEIALKRKNNNVVDLSWDNNTTETVVYAKVEGFPGRVLPNEHIIFDNKPMKILQRQIDEGMYTILLVSNEPKAVAL